MQACPVPFRHCNGYFSLFSSINSTYRNLVKPISLLPSSHLHFLLSMASSSSMVSYLVLTLLLFSFCEAKDIVVGGKTDAWKAPSSESDSLNHWAESYRFRVGDSLVWKYDAQKDSVLQVTKDAYVDCNVTNPIAEYKDGSTKVELDRSGPFYFISGVKGNCEKGEKLVVVVLSSKHKLISPAPSPMEFEGPAVAPTSGASGLKGGLMVMVVLGVAVALN